MAAGDRHVSPQDILGKQMLAGGLAGMLADGVMYPMMTVKSRLMVQGGGGGVGGGGGTAALYAYKGPAQAIYSIAAKEGWRTLYKGYSTVSQIAPAQALYMATYQTAKKTLPGIFACGKKHLSTGRFRSNVSGFLLAQMVWGPYNAVYLPLWEATKRACVWYSGAESVEKLNIHYELSSSFLSSAFAAGLTNPMDVIKTRLQVQGKSNVNNSTQYTGAWDAAKSIYKQEGVTGFTRGMTSRMLWVAPSAMIMFTTYDQIMKRLT